MRHLKITSISNQHVKDAVRLKEQRAGQRRTAFLIEGPHLLEMALNAGAEIGQVFVSERFMAGNASEGLLLRLSGADRIIFEVTEQILEKITDTEAPQGIAAVVAYTPLRLDAISFGQTPLLAIVDGIQDPGNLGTIIRTADAAGADAVILLPGTCDAFSQKVIRSTAGSIFNIPVVYAETSAFTEWLQREKMLLAVTAADAEKTIFEANLSGPLAIAFGNEARGVSSQLRKAADISLSIPIQGKAESLNVATSAAICLYETVRQRTAKINLLRQHGT